MQALLGVSFQKLQDGTGHEQKQWDLLLKGVFIPLFYLAVSWTGSLPACLPPFSLSVMNITEVCTVQGQGNMGQMIVVSLDHECKKQPHNQLI